VADFVRRRFRLPGPTAGTSPLLSTPLLYFRIKEPKTPEFFRQKYEKSLFLAFFNAINETLFNGFRLS